MQERLLVVYYGIDRLPYKDENREVHYPIVNSQSGGTLITGENNTSKLYFYVGRIGGGARQWIANIKKPDGTLAYQMCENGQSVELENGENDYRVELDISDLFADQVGDVFIGLQGYSGDTVIVENDGTYEISGDPIVLATGTIKIKVNYSPNVLAKGETITPTTEQLVMAALGAKLDKLNGIFVVANIQSESFDFSAFESGQTFLDLASKQFYRLDENVIARLPYELNYATVNGTLLTEILASKANDSDVVHIIGNETIGGNKVFTGIIYKNSISAGNIIATIQDVEDIVNEYVGGIIYRFKGSVPTYSDLPASGLQAGDVYNVEDSGINYAWTGTTWDALGGVGDLSNYYTKSETYSKTETNTLLSGKVDKVSSNSKIYATNGSGEQTSLDYGTSASAGNIVQRDSNGQVNVPQTPTNDAHATSKKYVDDSISDVMEVAEGKCKTYIISYEKESLTETYFSNGGKVYKTNGDEISTWADFQTYVDNTSCGNSLFNSQTDELDIQQTYILTNDNIIILPIDDGIKDGDVILVTQINVPDRWADKGAYGTYYQKLETSKVDLTNVATTNTDQSITGTKTFRDLRFYTASTHYTYSFNTNNSLYFVCDIISGNVTTHAFGIAVDGSISLENLLRTASLRPKDNLGDYDIGTSTHKYRNLYLSGNIVNKYNNMTINNEGYDIVFTVGNNKSLRPSWDNHYNLGTSVYRLKDIYVGGNISDGTNSATVAAIVGGIMNVIAASDIVSNTLTQEQYDLITNGKPTRIYGELFSMDNITLFLEAETSSFFNFIYFADEIGIIKVNKNSKIISKEAATYQAYNIRSLRQINGINIAQHYKKPQSSVSLSDGGTITDNALKTLIQNEQPIKLNGFTCYFSCDDGTNYQYVNTRFDATANKNHINVITINKTTWVATFHTSDLALS